MALNFFGLPPNYRYLLNVEIFSLVFNSKGGLIYSDVIDMPVKRRRAFTKLLQLAYEELERLMKKANRGESISNSRLITPLDSLMIRKMFLNKQL